MREALKLALEALSKVGYVPDAVNPHPISIAIAAVKEALAQPEQEPVAWMREDEMKAITSLEKDAWVECGRGELVGDYNKPLGYLSEGGAERLLTKKQAIEHIKNFKLFAHDVPIYTTPPQRTWVGLTDDEIDQGLLRSDYAFKTAEAWRAGVVFAMTKLKEKNT